MGNLQDYVTPYGKKVINMINEQSLVAKYYDKMAGMAYIPLQEYQADKELQGQVFALLLNNGTFYDDLDSEKTPHNFAMELVNLEGVVTLIVRDVIGYY